MRSTFDPRQYCLPSRVEQTAASAWAFPDELLDALDQHAIVSIADRAGLIVYVNDKFCDISGYSRSELVGASHRIVKSGRHPASYYAELWGTIATGRVWHGEIQNCRKDGAPYWVASTIVPVVDELGRPERYVSIRTDISRQKQLEDEVRGQKTFLNQITEALGEGILVEDREGRCIFANDEALRLLHRQRDELMGWSLNELVIARLSPISGSRSPEMPARAQSGRWRAGRYDGIFTRGDGRRVPVTVNVQLLGGRHHAEGTVFVFRGNSVDRRQKASLRREAAVAEQASRAKSAFLAHLSHEIRTPLNGILGLTRLALDEPADSTQIAGYLRRIEDSAQTLAGLVSDVLDLSKIEAGKLSLESVAFDLPALLRSIWDGYVELARQRGLDLTLSMAEDLPRHVTGDPMRVRQVLVNFLSNAIKFTEAGSISLSARCSGESRCRFEVKDTGIGIDAVALGNLFKPFAQASQATYRRYGGTGLGLSICRDLAQQMGGATGLSSEVGRGSSFWMEVPLAAAAAGAELQRARAADDRDIRSLRGLRVLLVEDNEVNTIIACAMLKRWNIDVVTVGNGLDAVRAIDAAGSGFDLVLMDLNMPVMDGRLATARIREHHSRQALPIIALTAEAFAHERRACLAIGMNDYLTKPLEPALLQAAICRVAAARGTAPPGPGGAGPTGAASPGDAQPGLDQPGGA